jgi:glycerol kinase
MARHILAIDQGTTNTKALVVDDRGDVVARASRPMQVSFPRPGWVEQDGRAIWHTVRDAIDDCLGQSGLVRPDAVAIANQRESVLMWDRRTGEPVGPCVMWQCRRTTAFCDELRRTGHGPFIARKTGLTIDPLFSASKIRWLLDHTPDGPARAASGDLAAGTVDSWVLWNLSGGAVHACDRTNASRTQLCDLTSGDWDIDLLSLFDVPRALLPEIRPSSSVTGVTVSTGALPAGVPVAALIGDSHAALFGHGAPHPGAVKATYGTGSSLMTPTPARLDADGLSTTVAWSLPGSVQFALEGNITDTGGAVDWVARLLGLDASADRVAALAAGVNDNAGVYLVPAFAGLGAPHWDDRARGLLAGLTRGAGPAEVARAAIESIAFQIADVFDLMRDAAGVPAAALLADGGASRNDHLMQLQADVLGAPVVRNSSADLSAIGAAWLAGLAVGIWPSLAAIEQLPRSLDRFEPRMPAGERARLRDGWRDAVARARLRGGR